ncbi:MAG TPA: S41 family peptidase, partial [Planctomycetota bacterium]|nr:S41 family peptidase [Planctomycetota bacterium]
NTRGLVIDVRGNGGGTRDILRAIFPYFMKATDPLHVANIAAYRLPPDVAPDKEEGYLQDRELHPVTSSAWSPEERISIEKFAKMFKPEWVPPAGQFSAWHYFALKRGAAPFHYERPAVILMDTNCFSATDIFLAAFKGWRNVTLIGTPSGGGSGRAQRYTLTNSKIQLKLSSIASFRRDGSMYDGKGVAPDVEVHPQPGDFLRARSDSVLGSALKRFKK